MEPLAVGMHACELSGAKLGEKAVVLGCGCIGLVTIMSLRARGVSEIYAVDVLDKRLQKAKEVGATRVFNGKTVITSYSIHYTKLYDVRPVRQDFATG